MITSKTISRLALMIIAVATLALNGCSIIGLTTGSLIDASRPDQTFLPGWQVVTIKPGTALHVLLEDGGQLFGRFAGLEPLPAAQYAVIYSRTREQKPLGILLPAPGDRIEITTSVTEPYRNYQKKSEDILFALSLIAF